MWELICLLFSWKQVRVCLAFAKHGGGFCHAATSLLQLDCYQQNTSNNHQSNVNDTSPADLNKLPNTGRLSCSQVIPLILLSGCLHTHSLGGYKCDRDLHSVREMSKVFSWGELLYTRKSIVLFGIWLAQMGQLSLIFKIFFKKPSSLLIHINGSSSWSKKREQKAFLQKTSNLGFAPLPVWWPHTLCLLWKYVWVSRPRWGISLLNI